MIRMLIVVQTAMVLGPGEQVYVAGNTDELGRWNPAGVAMTRTAPERWEAVLDFRSPLAFEFKITRGTWETEAADADGRPLPNQTVSPEPNRVVEVPVVAWKDGDKDRTHPNITGDCVKWPAVHSRWLELDRDVLIWLPPGYGTHPTRRYPVLYMHDGRQVFDPTTSTWGKDWRVDEWSQEMILNGELEPYLVVAADCTAARAREYAPGEQGDAYLRFLIEELKPMVDAQWRTDPERTYIAGSSMGGLISFYAGWTRPDVYAGAACLSPAFLSPYGNACFRMVEAAKGNLPPVRLFLSCGGEGKLEKRLLDGTLRMADTLRTAGMSEKDLSVRIESWAEHNEEAWARMTPHWLRFFFGRAPTPPPTPENTPQKPSPGGPKTPE